MKAIYTRTIGVYDDKLNEAMEISKGLAEVRKKHYPDHEVYFSFQVGGNPRTVRETLVGEQFTGLKGKYVKKEDTVKSFKGILEGEYDHIPEQAFAWAGGIDDVLEKAENLKE